MPARSEPDALNDVQERLQTLFSEIPAAQVREAVAHAYASLQHSRIRDYLPLLVERRVRTALSTTLTAGP